MKKLLGSLLLLLMVWSTAWAGEKGAPKPPLVRFEWGAQAGGAWWGYNTPAEISDLKCAMGWQVGITTALVWGKWALQPEVRFARHRLDFTPTPEAAVVEVKSNAIEVPILVSWRPTERWRIQAGPVITALNSCKHLSEGGLEFDLGRVRPTLGYTIGVGFKISKRLLLDARYIGGFSRVESILWEDGPKLKLKGHSLQLNLGVVLK